MGTARDGGTAARAAGAVAGERAVPGGGARLVGALRLLPRGLRSGAAQRARWGIVDQSISSFTNFAMTAVIARQVSPAAFGAFSVALAMYICVLWVARSLVGEPFVVRFTSSTGTLRRDAAGEAVGTAVALGAAVGLVAAAVGVAVHGTTGAALVTMGLFLPGLLAQDAYRYVLMADGRARAAAANDGVWLAAQAAAVVVLLAVGRADVVSLLAAFGTAATAAAVFGAWQAGAVPAVGRARAWLQPHADLWAAFLVELLTVNATPQLSMLAVAALGEVVAVGAVRAGMFLLAPLSVLFSGLYLVGLPEAVRLRHRSLPALRRFVVSLAVVAVALTFAWALALSLVPAGVGRELLRSNWMTGRRLLWPMAAFTAGTAATMAAIVGLRALEFARRSLRVRVWAGPVVFASGVIGAEMASGSGAATGLAVSSWLSAGLAWLMLQRALSAHPRDVPPEVPQDGEALVAEWA